MADSSEATSSPSFQNKQSPSSASDYLHAAVFNSEENEFKFSLQVLAEGSTHILAPGRRYDSF